MQGSRRCQRSEPSGTVTASVVESASPKDEDIPRQTPKSHREGALRTPRASGGFCSLALPSPSTIQESVNKNHLPKSPYLETELPLWAYTHLLKGNGRNWRFAEIPSRWFLFFWSTAALQCCVLFCVQQSESAMHTRGSLLFWFPFPLRSPEHWVELPMLLTGGSRCVWARHSLSRVRLLRPRGLQPARLLCAWGSPGKGTAVGSHSLLQGIFPTQGSNPGPLHCKQILYRLSHRGSPISLSYI